MVLTHNNELSCVVGIHQALARLWGPSQAVEAGEPVFPCLLQLLDWRQTGTA